MNGNDLWSVPVPVRSSTFTPSAGDYARYNVEVDLARIVPFGFVRTRPVDPQLLLADLQCNADGNANRRLGSGRSGYFQGKYLKGIGRTPLAANWTSADRYHSSGHLLPSAATREFVVSALLKAAGAASCINGCEAVLVRELPDLDEDWLVDLRGPTHSLCEADRRLQAITVKDGAFARPSNFLWAIDHFGTEPNWVSDYFLSVRRSLGGEGAENLGESDVTPQGLVVALAEAIERGLSSYTEFRSVGLHWGSVHNNFTADGRFLDLEVPLVIGQPFLGWVGLCGQDPRAGYWFGLEVLSYARQMGDFVRSYRERLRGLPPHRFSDLELEFLRGNRSRGGAQERWS